MAIEEATETEVSSKAPVQKILVFMAPPIFDAWGSLTAQPSKREGLGNSFTIPE